MNVKHAICIDTYAHGGGWLSCLDVKTGKLWQANEKAALQESWIDEYVSE